MKIRNYKNEDETNWVRCRVLSFLDTAYFDSVFIEKEKYDNPSIELVAGEDGIVAGILDIEMDNETRKVCKKNSMLSGMIWHVCVHPDYRRKGIAKKLLEQAEEILIKNKIFRIEAWTRDDKWVRDWYHQMGFKICDSYLHINFNYDELKGMFESKISKVVPIHLFAHYTGDDKDEIKNTYKRVNECVLFEKKLSSEILTT